MKPGLLIAVARHGQTDSNVKGLWVGNGDDPLNETGKEQARRLAKSLTSYNFDFIVSSDKRRSIQTAEIVSGAIGVPFYGQRKDLRDRDYGAMEGLTTDQIRERYGVEMKSLSKEIDDLGASETVASVLKRVKEFADIVRNNFDGKKIIVITHGAFIRSFYEMYVHESDNLRFTNCSHFIVRLLEGETELVEDLQTI